MNLILELAKRPRLICRNADDFLILIYPRTEIQSLVKDYVDGNFMDETAFYNGMPQLTFYISDG